MVKTDVQKETIIYLDPAKVLADNNARYGLKKVRIDSLANSILETNGVQSPVEVEPLDRAEDKNFTHRLTAGYYRHAAVSQLNSDGAGLLLPAIVREPPDALTRLRHQLIENRERENMSPMDEAIALRKLLDEGMDKKEARRLFARPTGRKGIVLASASNSWINTSLRFLELPKAIQQKIHDGLVSVRAAQELGRVTPDKRAAVLARAEKERTDELDREDAEEEKYLKTLQAVTVAEEKQQTTASLIIETKALIVTLDKQADTQAKALQALKKLPYLDLGDVEKRDTDEKVKALAVDIKGTAKALKAAKNKLADLLADEKKAGEQAETAQAKLNAAEKLKKVIKEKPVSKEEIKKAAAKEDASPDRWVALKKSDINDVVNGLMKDKRPKVVLIGRILARCFSGEATPRITAEDLAVVTGEKEAPKKKIA